MLSDRRNFRFLQKTTVAEYNGVVRILVRSLEIAVSAHKNSKNHKKVILFSSTLTLKQQKNVFDVLVTACRH